MKIKNKNQTQYNKHKRIKTISKIIYSKIHYINMSEESVLIKCVRLEFITSKLDNYNNEITYFKMKDKNIDQKFKPIIQNGFKLPWFKTDKNQNIMKVKTKYIKIKDLSKDTEILTDITFKYYSINDVEGFYVGSIN